MVKNNLHPVKNWKNNLAKKLPVISTKHSSHTIKSIEILAPAEKIIATIADFEKYPEWIPQVRFVKIKSFDKNNRPNRVLFCYDVDFLDDTFELIYRWEHAQRVISWNLASPTKIQRQQKGSYTVKPISANSSIVTYELLLVPNAPLIGAIRKKAEVKLIEIALNNLRDRVISLK